MRWLHGVWDVPGDVSRQLFVDGVVCEAVGEVHGYV